MRNRLLLLAASLVLLLASAAHAAPKSGAKSGAEDPDLFHTIEALDARVFDAYNRCDLKTFGSYFPEKLEFYHDNGGLTNDTRDSLVESVQKYICGKVRRDVVPGTVKVYPMHGFGAVEIGVHRFHHPGHDDTEGVGEAQFVMLWQYKDERWQITRVISFDHHEAGK